MVGRLCGRRGEPMHDQPLTAADKGADIRLQLSLGIVGPLECAGVGAVTIFNWSCLLPRSRFLAVAAHYDALT
jgi:hypothetical protein